MLRGPDWQRTTQVAVRLHPMDVMGIKDAYSQSHCVSLSHFHRLNLGV